jgi:hypothetical protein
MLVLANFPRFDTFTDPSGIILVLLGNSSGDFSSETICFGTVVTSTPLDKWTSS